MYYITDDMSRGLVNQKPYTRKKRKQSLKKMLNRSGINLPNLNLSINLKKYLSWWLIFVILIICGIFFVIKFTFFKPEYKIINIKISDNTLSTYRNDNLFEDIEKLVNWENFYTITKFNCEKILSKIQSKYQYVCWINYQLEKNETSIDDLGTNYITLWYYLPKYDWEYWTKTDFSISYSNKFLKVSAEDEIIWWTLWVNIQYCSPVLSVKMNDKKYVVWSNDIFVEVFGWSISDIKKDPKCIDTDDNYCESKIILETPQYLTWTKTLDWFFQEISLSNMVKIKDLAELEFSQIDMPNMNRFVYLAWSTRFAIFTDDYKTLYFNFNNTDNIEEQRRTQIEKYKLIKEKLDYDKFQRIEYLNLWLEVDKIIYKNYL